MPRDYFRAEHGTKIARQCITFSFFLDGVKECVENYFFRVTDDEESVLCSGTYLSGSWDSNPCWLCDENVVPEWVEGCVEAGAESRFVGYRVDHAKVRWVAS